MDRLMTVVMQELLLQRLYDALDLAMDHATHADALERWSQINSACNRAGAISAAGELIATLESEVRSPPPDPLP